MAKFPVIIFILACCWSCSSPGLLRKKQSPHQEYAEKLTEAGLKQTTIGNTWFLVAEESLAKPIRISTPYKETGYFPAEKPTAVGLRFKATRGVKLKIRLEKKPATNFPLYLDLWRTIENSSKPDFLMTADTTTNQIDLEVETSGDYQVRLQPELLVGGEYTLTITTGPSLAFPAKKGNIQSVWGDSRSGGERTHEGIDIFAPRKTPALAAASGRVTRVNENTLGGKVVWLRPSQKNYTLYYAHLDSQMVQDGQDVQIGDTIGLIGNTGNAITTTPHLHFGIYGFGGAIDPLPFVDPSEKKPEPVSSIQLIGQPVRVNINSQFFNSPDNGSGKIQIPVSSFLTITGATGDWYKGITPNGLIGFIKNSNVRSIDKAISQIELKTDQPLFDQPNNQAARKSFLTKGEKLPVLAIHEDFLLVRKNKMEGWVNKPSVQ